MIEHSDGVWYLIIEDAVLVDKDICVDDKSSITAFESMIQERYNCLIPSLQDFEPGEDILDDLQELQITDRKSDTSSTVKVTISSNTTSFVAISGVSMKDSDENNSIFTTTQKVMTRMQCLLLENGSCMDAALQVTIYVREMESFGELNRAYTSFVSVSSPPTRFVFQ